MQVFNPVRQSTVDAIGKTGLRTNRASHPGGFAHLQLPLSPSFSGKVSTSSRCHIAAAHFDASTTPRDSIPPTPRAVPPRSPADVRRDSHVRPKVLDPTQHTELAACEAI